MKGYSKPIIIKNITTKFEGVYADSGDQEVKVECPKPFNKYNVDWTCQGKCPYYQEVPGWSWLNDKCTLA